MIKGMTILGGVIFGGAALAVAPVLTISSPLWGVMGATYTINGFAAAGVAAATATGAGLGKVAGETGGALVIQGLSNASQKLLNKISPEKQEQNQ